MNESEKKDWEIKVELWCKKLSLLCNLSLEDCKKIANEKIDSEYRRVNQRFDAAQNYVPRGRGIIPFYPSWIKQAEKEYDKFFADRSYTLEKIRGVKSAHTIIIIHNNKYNTTYCADNPAFNKDVEERKKCARDNYYRTRNNYYSSQ